MEEALTLTGNVFPMCIVTVLHLTNGPNSERVQQALDTLQSRHVLLQCSIEQYRSGQWFRRNADAACIPFEVTESSSRSGWKEAATAALNTPIPSRGPLMRCHLVEQAGNPECELILSFHHAMVDAGTCRLLLHELLCLCNDLPLAPAPVFSEASVPATGRGWIYLLRFVYSMFVREWNYRRKGIRQSVPLHSTNGFQSIQFTPEVTRKLMVVSGRMGFSLNAVLMAALTRTVVQQQYANPDQTLARLVSFIDLREIGASTKHAYAPGCEVSMMPFDTAYTPDLSLSSLAGQIHRAIVSAGRRGDAVYLYKLAPLMMRMVLKKQRMRLGITALSFMGSLDLQPVYGATVLREVSAFVPTNKLGPGFSAFAKTLFGSLSLHFTYLTAEFSDTEAERMALQVKEILEDLAKKT
jgi:hypothetical protein